MGFVLRRICVVVLMALSLASCDPGPHSADMSSREIFARTVMNAATSGSVDEVEELAGSKRVNVRPAAEELIASAAGWNPDGGDITLTNDFPDISHARANFRNDSRKGVDFTIVWAEDRWLLLIGDPDPAQVTPASKPLAPGTAAPSDLKSTSP